MRVYLSPIRSDHRRPEFLRIFMATVLLCIRVITVRGHQMADYRAEHVSSVRDVSNHLRVSRGWSGDTHETPGKSTSGTPA